MIRVQSKLDKLFANKIDLTDATNDEERQNKYYTRAIAALAIVMRCGIDYDSAAKTITDGYHDMGIDAVYNDASQKKLILVQSKWRKDGNGSVSQEEASTFIAGIKRVINLDFDGCNKKLAAKQAEITAAIRDMDYQIEMIFCYTGSQSMDTYALRPIDELFGQVNEDDTTELLVLSNANYKIYMTT